MSELPQGTVTFLFTDIEGSTELLKRLGPRYAEVLEGHARILREAASSHGGREIDNQGDSFFFAFARANGALGAAVVAQRALAAHDWPDGVDVRVRMGLHTGEPSAAGERYVGLGVHRAARIGAAGHGGQVLLSNATRELVEEELDGVVVRELGLYKLKDIDRPERLYQLDIGGLPSDFAPLKAEKADSDRHFSRRPVVIGALAGVIAAAVAIPVFALGGGSGEAGAALDVAENNSLAVIAPGSGRLVADPGVGATPTAVAYGEGAYWVANADGDSVSRIAPATNQVVDTVANVGSSPSAITIGGGSVWVTNSLDGTVAKIDPGTNTVVQTITVGNGPVGIVYAAGAVWVANTADGTITRIDPSSGNTSKRSLPIAATKLAYGDGTLWATQRASGQVVRIDPASGALVAPIRVGNGPTGIAFGDGSAWVANSLDGTISRVDPGTNSVSATIPTGDTPTGVALDARGGVWVANQYGGTLSRIDPKTNQPGKPIDVGNQPQGIATAGGQLLVSVAARQGVGHRGGTLKIALSFGLDAIDTAAAYSTASWPILHLTNDGLVAFDHASGVAGDQLVPDLAVSLPEPTDGGKTYTFRLRPHIRYSDGKPVEATDVRASFERYYRNGTLPVSFYDGIVGAAACRSPSQRCDLSKGIVADNRTKTVTFHLTSADPEFLYQLAVPTASVVPAGTPPKLPGGGPGPATGPYRISAYRADHYLTLVRNRYFREWSRAAQPDGYPNRIEIRISPKNSADDLIKTVASGRADLVSTLWTNSPTQSQLDATMSQYASQVHTNPLPTTNGLFLNTRVAPFNRVDVRRALNYAVDRTAFVQESGGSVLAAPSCQILPPGLPGYRPYCPYTASSTSSGKWSAPDLTKARTLVARSGTRGMKVTMWVDNYTEAIGPPVTNLLRSLGYRPSVKVVQNGKGFIYFNVVGDSRKKAQIGIFGWTADYPAPSDFFLQLFTCAAFKSNSPANANYPEFCDPAIDRQIKRALAQEVLNPQAADQLWQGVDRALTDQSVIVSLNSSRTVDVVSKRVGNYQYSGNGFGVLIDQLWVR
ncbi:MAG TPA: ABC transporter substrate-binding protein [Gaiellaceae bacterium]|nr:ABC transporter substrate-binding protein [Gaiellaceae bacterium]